MSPAPLYGLMAEFETPDQILAAARRAWQAGYREMDAYTPYSVEGLAAELGMHRTRLPGIVLIGGLVGAAVGYGMQYYTMAVDYPFNVGNRPYNSWPVFMPVTFEVMVLVASFAAVLGMLFLNGLPRPHHAVFNVARFARASQDHFFLCIEATDARFDRQETAQFLRDLSPLGEIILVPRDPELVHPPSPLQPSPETSPVTATVEESKSS